VSLRNRELVNLLVVAVVTGVGFASVYIARQSVISTGSLSYGIFFLCLYLVAHVAVRLTARTPTRTAPDGGPSLGGRRHRDLPAEAEDALRQGLWIVIALALFVATLVVLRRDYRRLESYKYIFGLSAIGLLILPALPHFGQTVNGARLWVRVGSLQFQPGELAKIMLIVFLAGYLREKREVLAQGRLKDFGPLLVIWGACMLVLVGDEGSRQRASLLRIFLAMLYVATARLTFVWIGLGSSSPGRTAPTRRCHTSVTA